MMQNAVIVIAFALGCGGSSPERETVATLPTPPAVTATATATATATLTRSDDGWPCERPPIITEHQEATLEQMTKSGRPDLVQQAAEIRAKVCAGWAHRNP